MNMEVETSRPRRSTTRSRGESRVLGQCLGIEWLQLAEAFNRLRSKSPSNLVHWLSSCQQRSWIGSDRISNIDIYVRMCRASIMLDLFLSESSLPLILLPKASFAVLALLRPMDHDPLRLHLESLVLRSISRTRISHFKTETQGRTDTQDRCRTGQSTTNDLWMNKHPLLSIYNEFRIVIHLFSSPFSSSFWPLISIQPKPPHTLQRAQP